MSVDSEPKLRHDGPPPLAPVVSIGTTSSSGPSPTSHTPPSPPPILDARPRRLGRPDLISRNSAQSSRTSISSSVQSIPEDGSVRPLSAQSKPRRASILGSHPRPGSASSTGSGGETKNRTGRARKDMSREGYEMGMMGSGLKTGGSAVFSAAVSTGSAKEDVAMAKWRKWAVDQPAISPLPTSLSSRKLSTSSQPPYHQPLASTLMTAPSSTLPSLSLISNPPFSRSSQHVPETFLEERSSRSQSATDSGGQDQRALGGGEIFLTDTVRALQDVELAVDEDAIQRSAVQARQNSRLLSQQSRLSEAENPFIDIQSRLISRRIRPVVLELVQALGHYIFVLWSLKHPDSPCPWIIPAGEGPSAPMEKVWRSRTITAAAAGLAEGHVLPPSPSTLAYWRSEVKYGLADVDELVGRWKKQGLVFGASLEKAGYGKVEDGNVLGKINGGGNIARLLNDLEEILWGDGLPRSTDLVYLLPDDFDPYAVTEAQLLAQQAAGVSSTPNDMFGPSIFQQNPFDPLSDHARAVMDEVHAMPDLIPASPSQNAISSQASRGVDGGQNKYLNGTLGEAATGGANTNQGVAGAWVRQARASLSVQPGGSLLGHTHGDGDPLASLTLEEIGRIRHADWLAAQKA